MRGLSGLLAEVLPELAATIGCEQPPENHPEGDVFTHIRLMLSQLPDTASIELSWSVLMHDIAKPVTFSCDDDGRIRFFGHEKIGVDMARAILKRLRFANAEVAAVTTCVRHHMQMKDAQQMRTATLRKVFLRPTFPTELELHRLDCLSSSGRLDNFEFLKTWFETFKNQPELQEPLIDGGDLIALGQAPGPEFGKVLDEARERQLEGEITTRKEALAWLEAKIRAGCE